MNAHLEPELDLVLPILDEAHVLEDSVLRLMSRALDYDLPEWRVVIADNGSTDGSREVGERLERDHERVSYFRLEQRGRGLALRRAWTETEARFSLYMDIDLSTGLEAIPVAVGHLLDGADVVTGSRLHHEAKIERCLKREVLSRGYNALIGLLFERRDFDDAQCGFKGVRTSTVRRLLPLVENNHWFFDTELLILAEAAGLTVRSFPVSWKEDLDTRVKIASTVWEDLKGLARVRWHLGEEIREWKSATA